MAGITRRQEPGSGWLLRAIAGSPDQVQIMYGIAGERYLPEREITWLAGYEDSKPVRIGNAASEQLQLDIYGEVMAAFSSRAETARERRGAFICHASGHGRASRNHLAGARRGHLGDARGAADTLPIPS